MKLRIAEKLDLPLDWMTLATVVYGARGSGKTTFGSVVAEELTKAHQRFCAIDLKGDWWGLKSSRDGRSDGIPVVIFGGDHADVPLEDGAGAFVGETVAGLSQSVILDFEHFSKGKQIRFLTEFFLALYHKNRDPLLLLADEAQRYAPQKPIDPDAAKCLGAVEDVVKLGRKHGLGVVLFTQRGSGLNKEVSELCDLLVAFRTPGPLDQDRIKDWLDANTTREQRDAVMTMLAKQPTGTAVFASGHPGLALFGSHEVRQRETFDSSATPKIGQRRAEPKVLAKPDLDDLTKRMSAAIERAKADDPKELRRTIAELRKELARKVEPTPAPKPVVERVEVPVFGPKDLDRIEGAASMLRQAANDAKAIAQELGEVVARARAPRPASAFPVSRPQMRAAKPAAEPQTSARESHRPPPNGDFTGPEQRVLDSLAWWASIGIEAPDKGQVGFIAKYRVGKNVGGTFGNLLGSLRGRGLIDYPSAGSATLTDAGRDVARPPQEAPTVDTLHRAVMDRMDGPEARVLQVLIDAYPEAMTKQECGARAGYSVGDNVGGTFGNILGRLRSLGLIDYPQTKTVVALPVLFLE